MFSLVTACMNREAHLRRSLPAWLALPGLGEVVIVDWSNATPLFGLAQLDPRIRVVRVEGEERWILSYAYNLGVSRARQDVILKCDADCLPRPDAVRRQPDARAFCAGFWKSGIAAGKPSVNGQCLFRREQFERVNGYSEFIRTYGRDDEDFYQRLTKLGLAREEIPPAELDFIEHTHEERIQNQFGAEVPARLEERIYRDTGYNEMRNYYLAQALPWGPARPRAAFLPDPASAPGGEVVRRQRAAELAIPPEIAEAAGLYSLRYFVKQHLNLPIAAALKLDRNACVRLLVARLAPAA